MRVQPDFLSADDLAELASEVEYKEFDDPIIRRLVAVLRETYPKLSTEFPSYCRVEHKLEGHPWHVDTGTSNHMMWARVTARVLLTKPEVDFTGGGFFFADAPHDALFGYGELMHFRSDVEHCVARHKGNRRVLLMFFGEDDG